MNGCRKTNQNQSNNEQNHTGTTYCSFKEFFFRLYFLEIDSIIPFFQIHNTVIICGLERDLVVRNRYFLITM